MAANQLELNTISHGLKTAKLLLEQVKPVVDVLNKIYDTETIGLKYTITQEDLDGIPSLSGLTKSQLDDGMYVLTALVRTNLSDGLFALSQLSARA